MSTDLYGLRVLAKKEKEVTLQVFLLYYDWDTIPSSKDFFLSCFWDEADTRFGGGGPLGDAVSVEEICSEEFRLENGDKYIEEVEELSRLNYPIQPGVELATFYYERDGKWQDEDKLAQVMFRVKVTDPKWIQHLEVGMSWATTSYGI